MTNMIILQSWNVPMEQGLKTLRSRCHLPTWTLSYVLLTSVNASNTKNVGGQTDETAYLNEPYEVDLIFFGGGDPILFNLPSHTVSTRSKADVATEWAIVLTTLATRPGEGK